MFLVSIPNSDTFSLFVDRATKCEATAVGGARDKNQRFADLALLIVSCVVKVFEAIMNNVVSA